ncbi:hypothetical protein NDU88_003019 [Pleurodeles waltl]|uniref:Uncharacterized protein n=1 Tax=Pleurodeles waltl TaxID=8319 RepID=A0AAV7Q8L9_PLEWA|nr:hypothetical protein NDU88_003019 [Pleurodeles waltl]
MHLHKVLAAIADTTQALQQDISAVLVGLGLLRAEHHKLAERVKTVKTTVEEIKAEQAERLAPWVALPRRHMCSLVLSVPVPARAEALAMSLLAF